MNYKEITSIDYKKLITKTSKGCCGQNETITIQRLEICSTCDLFKTGTCEQGYNIDDLETKCELWTS